MALQSDTELTAIRHGQRVTGEDYMYTVKDGMMVDAMVCMWL